MTIQEVLLAYDDPTNGGAGHHNVVYAERQLNQLILQERIDQVKSIVTTNDDVTDWDGDKLIFGYIDIDSYEINELLAELKAQLEKSKP